MKKVILSLLPDTNPGTMIWIILHLHKMCFHTILSISGLMVFENKIFKDVLYFFLRKNRPPPSHDLSKHESTEPEDASTQIWAFMS